jgi:dUTP pyrophosphatase
LVWADGTQVAVCPNRKTRSSEIFQPGAFTVIHRYPPGWFFWRVVLDQLTIGAALDRDSLGQLLQTQPSLVEGYLSLEQQLQPNGFDLTLNKVSRLSTPGSMGAAPDDRELSNTEPLDFEPGGWLGLTPGPYLVDFNEIVNLPLNVMALGRPRSSLLRSGVAIHTAVWDAGYHGRSQALLVVHQSAGYRVQRDARLLQLVFYRLAQPVSQGYQGRFQGENI